MNNNSNNNKLNRLKYLCDLVGWSCSPNYEKFTTIDQDTMNKMIDNEYANTINKFQEELCKDNNCHNIMDMCISCMKIPREQRKTFIKETNGKKFDIIKTEFLKIIKKNKKCSNLQINALTKSCTCESSPCTNMLQKLFNNKNTIPKKCKNKICKEKFDCDDYDDLDDCIDYEKCNGKIDKFEYDDKKGCINWCKKWNSSCEFEKKEKYDCTWFESSNDCIKTEKCNGKFNIEDYDDKSDCISWCEAWGRKCPKKPVIKKKIELPTPVYNEEEEEKSESKEIAGFSNNELFYQFKL